MKLLHSIQFKFILLFISIVLVIFAAGIYSRITVTRLTDSVNTLFHAQTPITRSIQQSLVSLGDANSALGTAMVVSDFAQIEDVRLSEAEFNSASFQFSMYINALIWGSTSEAFNNVSGGLIANEWNRQGLNKTLQVPKVEKEQSQLIGQADIFFGSFQEKSIQAFSLKKKLLRLIQTPDEKETQTTEIKLAILLDQIKTDKEKLSQLMKQMIDANDAQADREIQLQQQLMGSLLLINAVLPFVSGGIILGIGLFLSRVLIILPIQKLSKTAEKISEGNVSERAEIVTNDEIGNLAQNFNKMTDSLVQRTLQVVKEQVKLQASIDSLNLGFIMVDNNNQLIKLNGAAKKILMTNSGASETQPCDMPFIINALSKGFDILPNLEKCKKEKTLIDAKEVPLGNAFLHIFIAPILEKQDAIGCVVLIEDVTEQKVLERSKDEFFSIASHELRTPLTSIRGNSSMIKEFYGEKLQDPQLHEMVEDIHESSVRLIGIVNDFLDVSRLEQGKMEFKKEPFDLSVLITDVVKEMGTNATDKHIALTFNQSEQHPSALGDKNKIKEVLINLIGNSIKFTDHGEVRIMITEDQKFLKVNVSDTGRGIPPENQKLLFRKFQQAGSSLLTRDTTKGTGLGLYISKLIIEAQGGTIQLETSREGEGTTFSFTVPLTTGKESLKQAGEPHETVDSATGLTVNSSTNPA